MNFAKFLSRAFSIEHFRWLLLCLLEMEEKESVEQKQPGKIVQIKEENEIIFFYFYLQVFVLVIEETQIQISKY